MSPSSKKGNHQMQLIVNTKEWKLKYIYSICFKKCRKDKKTKFADNENSIDQKYH
jgi:hypothetical protein